MLNYLVVVVIFRKLKKWRRLEKQLNKKQLFKGRLTFFIDQTKLQLVFKVFLNFLQIEMSLAQNFN